MTRIATGKRSNSRWAKTVPSSVALVPLPCGQAAAENGDAGELARARRQDGVSEQADPEGGEDLAEGRVRLRQRLVDRQAPGERAREDGEQVEQDADDHPAPGDDVERVETAPHSGPRHQIARIAAPSSGEHEDPARPRVAGEPVEARSRGAPPLVARARARRCRSSRRAMSLHE